MVDIQSAAAELQGKKDRRKKPQGKNIIKKTKVRFSCLLQLPARKQRGPILVLALQKFVTYLLT